MGKQFEQLNEQQIKFIRAQHIFFVGTAGCKGRVNISPKGMDSLRVLSPTQILWLNLTGSGNETAAHVFENGRMTLMFLSFTGNPQILRVYGDAQAIHSYDEQWKAKVQHFPHFTGARQIFEVHINLVQTSCGFGVPLYEYQGERELLNTWAEKKAETSLEEYWEEKNSVSIDGKPTHILGK